MKQVSPIFCLQRERFSAMNVARWLMTLLAVVLISIPETAVSAVSAYWTSPDDDLTKLKKHGSGTFDSNGVTVKWEYGGTYYDNGDWNGTCSKHKEFVVVNATITVEKPYIEFAFLGRDTDKNNVDETYCNELFVKYKNEKEWSHVCLSYVNSMDLVNGNYAYNGAAVRVKTTTNETGFDGGELHYWRYYPLNLDWRNPIEEIYIVSYVDYGDNGGGIYPYAGYSKGYDADCMFRYTIPVSYDFSSLQVKGELAQHANGEVTWRGEDIPGQCIFPKKLERDDSGKVNKNQSLKDTVDAWDCMGYFRVLNTSGRVGVDFIAKDGGKVDVMATRSYDNYSVSRTYALTYEYRNYIILETNGCNTNRDYRYYQEFIYEDTLGSFKAIYHPLNAKATNDPWAKQTTLTWDAPSGGDYNTDGKWYVYRKVAGENDSQYIPLTPDGIARGTRKYVDDVPEYDVDYVYAISFSLTEWEVIGPEPSLSVEVKNTLERTVTLNLQPIENVVGEDSITKYLTVRWTHQALKENVTFHIFRKDGDAGEWHEVHKMDRKSKTTQEHSWNDASPSDICMTYSYKVAATILDEEVESEVLSCGISGGSQIENVLCSKGAYANMVKVQWHAHQVGAIPTRYVVLRRQLGMSGSFAQIYVTEGTASTYYFEDNTAQPGNYYEYKVEAYAMCDEKYSKRNEMMDDGFSLTTGIISGRVTYGTGVAVAGTKVVLSQSEGEDVPNQFYSLLVGSMGGGVQYKLTAEESKALFADGKVATVQFWMHPNTFNMQGSTEQNRTVFATEDVAVYLHSSSSTNEQFRLILAYNRTDGALTDTTHTNIYVAPDKYAHLALTIGKSNVTFRVIDADTIMREEVSYTSTATIETLRWGSPLSEEYWENGSFFGQIDEIRVWSGDLSDQALRQNYDHLLAGTESGLMIYWPLDEGIKQQQTAYDYSKTSGVANARHGSILPGTIPNTVVPTEEQFSLKGITDAEGNYVIRGVPFTGDGTNYVVTPQLGIHKYSPAYRTRYVSANSLTHSGVDFDDMSSFPVRGTVYYENTDYPVAGATLYVDDVICSRNGAPVVTLADGSFEISVPIGDHYIEVRKDNHTFVNNGRYPADPNDVGVLETFDAERNNLRFYDNTLVTVAGRVVGGERESSHPLGLGLSENNIGTAMIKLSPGSNRYRMNVEVNDLSIDDGQVDITVKSPTDAVNSRAWRQGAQSAATSNDDVRYIFIETDSKTGEFAALLPPIAYTIEDISIASNPDLIFHASDYSVLDASHLDRIYTDSLYNSDTEQTEQFTYYADLRVTHREKPTFIVTDEGNDKGAWGAETYVYTDELGRDTTLTLYSVESDGTVRYLYDYPIFIEYEDYSFSLQGYETYVNKDGEEPVYDHVPLADAIVTIANPMSVDQTVYAEGDSIGEIYDLQANQLLLDSVGEATYKWSAGFPNINGDFTRAIDITYENNGQTVAWDGNDTFKGIVIGTLPTGQNFVTGGPDRVDMILRDPPGTASSVYWEAGETNTNTHTWTGGFSGGAELSLLTRFGFKAAVNKGTAFLSIIRESEAHRDMTTGIDYSMELLDGNTWAYSTTTTKRVSTSDDENYVGAAGDVFIGAATNITFGKARAVEFKQDLTDGHYSIQLQEAIVTGQEFETSFAYTQYHIETYLIPNLYATRKSWVIPVSAADYDNYVNTSDSVIYISKLSPDDEEFVWEIDAKDYTSATSYKMLLPATADANKVYTDTVAWYTQQIKTWIDILKDNEKQKVSVIESDETYLRENVSFDSGVAIEGTEETDTTHTHDFTREYMFHVIGGLETGFEVRGRGLVLSFTVQPGAKFDISDSESKENTLTFGYSLKETGPYDALSVDIYESPDNLAPIFVTRGGQTCCPHESGTFTKYYTPGKEISAGTMQVEVPDISVTHALVTDVPSGGQATYELHLANLSEVGPFAWFDLALVEESNPYGASISMDGLPLTDGRAMLLNVGQDLVKTIQLEQTDESVLDYENIQLVLRSQCQAIPTGAYPAIGDTVSITAHFVPTCSPITLGIEERTLNLATGGVLEMTLSDFNRGYRNFRGLRVQYKYANDAEWSLAQEFVLSSEDLTNSNMLLPEGSPVTFRFDMSDAAIYPDGNYTFRAVTMCDYGTGMIYNESEEIPVIKDMIRPQILGSPQPSSGILTADDDIYVTFNEPIRSGMLTDANNFIITAALNGSAVDHNVAMQMHATDEETAQTEASIAFANKSFAADMWLNVTSAGTILEHGSKGQLFRVSIDANSHLVVTINGESYVSAEVVLPTNKWMFLTFNYAPKADGGVLNAAVAYDNVKLAIFDEQPVVAYNGIGRLTVGKQLEGAIHELALWNTARSVLMSQAEMYVSKSASTPNLIGYWKMHEGNGTAAKDVARNRHMLTTGNWALNNTNYAAAFAGDGYVAVDISTCTASDADDYAIELWFEGTTQKNATIFSVGDSLVRLQTNGEGYLALVLSGTEHVLGTTNYLDGTWHHFALNVLRNGVTGVYIDGVHVLQVSSAEVPALQSDAIVVGARRSYNGQNNYIYDAYFTGAVDEVRYWLATLTGKMLADNRFARIDTATVVGLGSYCPFESTQRDEYGQWVTSFDVKEVYYGKSQSANVEAAVSAPGLREVPIVDNLLFNYTASDTQIFIELLNTPVSLEGTTVSFTLRNVRDLNNNIMQPVVWTAYVRQNKLVWSTDAIALSMDTEQDMQKHVIITNQSGTNEVWNIVGVPSWLEVSETEGALRPLSSKLLTFSADPTTPYGTYEETIYLTGNDGINEPLVVSLNVNAPAPSWKDDFQSSKFTFSMNIIGQVRINGKLMDDERDQLAAFIDDQCVGVVSPVYYERYDAYYIYLDVYGNVQELARPIHFRVWDASTGEIYPAVSDSVYLIPNKVVGSLQDPFIWETRAQKEQTMLFTEGWNWKSLYIWSEANVQDMFADVTDKIQIIKGHKSIAMPYDTTWMGPLKQLQVGELYKIRASAPTAVNIYGTAIIPAEYPITIQPNWNWIGINNSVRMSLNDAFAGLDPVDGDLVKGQNGFSVYAGYEWVGTLDALEPGAGYMYQSKATEAKMLIYPTAAVSRSSHAVRRMPHAEHFTPVSLNKYAGTMTVIAIVMHDGEQVMDAEVGVFVGDECRGAIMLDQGLAFLNIYGEGYGDKLTFKVMIDEQLYEVESDIIFSEDAMYGMPNNPYVIQISATALEYVTFESLGDMRIYSPTGAYVGKASENLPQGVYIVGGKKVFLHHSTK